MFSMYRTLARFFGPAPLRKCVGGFLLYKIWRSLAGILLEDFSGHPQKWEKIRQEIRGKIAAQKKIAKKNQRPKKKSAKNPFYQKPTLTLYPQSCLIAKLHWEGGGVSQLKLFFEFVSPPTLPTPLTPNPEPPQLLPEPQAHPWTLKPPPLRTRPNPTLTPLPP